MPIEAGTTRRLFVALSVPPAAAETLAALPRRGLDASWVAQGDLHITLRFLGDVEEPAVPAIVEALSRVRRPPVPVEIDGLGCFHENAPRILYARVASIRKVTALCAEVTDALTPLGFDFGAKPFIPHITLARLRQAGDVVHYLERNGGAAKSQWISNSFALVQSGRRAEGDRQHRTLQNYALI